MPMLIGYNSLYIWRNILPSNGEFVYGIGIPILKSLPNITVPQGQGEHMANPRFRRHYDRIRQHAYYCAVVREHGVCNPTVKPQPGDMIVARKGSLYTVWYYLLGGDCTLVKGMDRAPACLTDHLRQTPELPQAERDDWGCHSKTA